jgi:hypothetical protein
MYRALFQAQHCLKGQRPGPELCLPKAMETSTGALSPQINLSLGCTVTPWNRAEQSHVYLLYNTEHINKPLTYIA